MLIAAPPILPSFLARVETMAWSEWCLDQTCLLLDPQPSSGLFRLPQYVCYPKRNHQNAKTRRLESEKKIQEWQGCKQSSTQRVPTSIVSLFSTQLTALGLKSPSIHPWMITRSKMGKQLTLRLSIKMTA